MPKITYIEHDGHRFTHDVPLGNSVMEGAVDNGVEGIIAACGGCMNCATCHCYVAPEWLSRVGPPSDEEDEILDNADRRQTNSRLSCQIVVTEALDGLVIDLPESQY